MDGFADDTAILDRIEAARERTLRWLDSLQVEEAPTGVSRISVAHDPAAWPGVLLPGTYNAVMCRALLDGLGGIDRAALTRWLLSHRRADGVFRIPGMNDADVFKRPDRDETWRYIDWHVTNYGLGAVDALSPAETPLLTFAEPYLDIRTLKAWLADRDLRDPWLEGNNIVNLGGFLLLMRADPALRDRVVRALDVLFTWHDYHQEPSTGFWGVGQDRPLARLHAMAGSMHNYHLWYKMRRALPRQDKAVDYALSCAPLVVSACIDVDLVDLLTHAHTMIDHRRAETKQWLRTELQAILRFQNEDGGFCDEREGVRRQDGWIAGYAEPQGLSNTFATFFRWIAIAMIADLLWPGAREWGFRRMVGIGFRVERGA